MWCADAAETTTSTTDRVTTSSTEARAATIFSPATGRSSAVQAETLCRPYWASILVKRTSKHHTKRSSCPAEKARTSSASSLRCATEMTHLEARGRSQLEVFFGVTDHANPIYYSPLVGDLTTGSFTQDGRHANYQNFEQWSFQVLGGSVITGSEGPDVLSAGSGPLTAHLLGGDDTVSSVGGSSPTTIWTAVTAPTSPTSVRATTCA